VGRGAHLAFVAAPLDGDNRPEHLALDDLGRLLNLGRHGRRVEPPIALETLTACEDLGSVAASALHEAGHPLELLLRGHRTHGRLRVARVADAQLGDLVAERRYELVVRWFFDDDPARGGAVLAAVGETEL